MTRFDTTSWSLILRAASRDEEEARLALALLCEQYWWPVYAYIRRQGVSAADCEDLTQGYFTRFLEKDFVRDVQRDRGRFRAFLLVTVRHYLSGQRDRERAQKRGGGRRLVSLDSEVAEARLASLPASTDRTPEEEFLRNWAQSVLERVHERLALEEARRGRGERFARLRPYLVDEEGADYAAIAGEWGVGESAVRVALHRLRRRRAEVLREEIARTVEKPEDVEDEQRRLLGALQA